MNESFLWINVPFERELDLSLAISYLKIHEEPGTPWNQWSNDPLVIIQVQITVSDGYSGEISSTDQINVTTFVL